MPEHASFNKKWNRWCLAVISKIEEPIVVAAIFGRRSSPEPVWFIWHDRRYRILKITYIWIDREGQAKRYHFSVTDGANLYELCYHTGRLSWELAAIETDG